MHAASGSHACHNSKKIVQFICFFYLQTPVAGIIFLDMQASELGGNSQGLKCLLTLSYGHSSATQLGTAFISLSLSLYLPAQYKTILHPAERDFLAFVI